MEVFGDGYVTLPFHGNHVIEDLLPQLNGIVKVRQELCYYLLELDYLRVHWEGSLQSVDQHVMIFCLLLEPRIGFLGLNHHLQVTTQLQELISMEGLVGDGLSDDQAVVKIPQETKSPPPVSIRQ